MRLNVRLSRLVSKCLPAHAGRAPAVAVGVLLLVAFAWALAPSERPPPPLALDKPAPSFRLPTLDGGELSLESLRGHVVLLNFWATWCPPCEAEMPAMERLYKIFAPRGLELLAVSVDARRDREKVANFRARLGTSFPILLDPEKRVATRYQSARFPESFLIDQHGVLRAHYIGEINWDDARYHRQIARWLAASN